MTPPTDTAIRYYLQFKKADGTYEILGPFKRRAIAVITFKKHYLREYGTVAPPYFFGFHEGDAVVI